jgi:hypothetical protein
LQDLEFGFPRNGSSGKTSRERIASRIVSIDVFARPVSQDEPIACDTILSLTKLLGEGTMQDAKVILGWKMDSHLLAIALSDDKYACWTKYIGTMIKK